MNTPVPVFASTVRLRSARRRRFDTIAAALPFLLPVLLVFLTFILYPLLATIRLSFYEWDGFSGSPQVFVGLDNYRAVLTQDPVFWRATRNSLIWVFLSLLVPTMLGLLLAMALNQKLAGRTIYRTLFYLPAVLAPIAVATMWRWIYNPNFGAVNYLLRSIGLGALVQPWLGDPNIALYSIFVASSWVVTGLNMVLFLAGLQNVPQELTEAARIDGANNWQVFRNVTIPALQPTFVIVIALTVINSLKVFDLVVGMTGGGPAQSTQVLALWSYAQSFSNHQFGDGSAIATILLIITLMIVIPYLYWTQREEN